MARLIFSFIVIVLGVVMGASGHPLPMFFGPLIALAIFAINYDDSWNKKEQRRAVLSLFLFLVPFAVAASTREYWVYSISCCV